MNLLRNAAKNYRLGLQLAHALRMALLDRQASMLKGRLK